jgi:hypothetical protein
MSIWNYLLVNQPVWISNVSNLTSFAIFGGIVSIYKSRKCSSCWRPAHHPVAGTHYKTCHKHSSVAWHAKLHQDHSEKYPDEHHLLNKDVYEH